MIGGKIPRYLVLVLTLGAFLAVVMLSMVYGEYRWLANEITATSVAEHGIMRRAAFERHASAQLRTLADRLARTGGTDSQQITELLDRAAAGNDLLTGLEFTGEASGTILTGTLPAATVGPGRLRLFRYW